MNIESIYNTQVYEVLSENTHKYSSTSVSGGGGYVSGHNGNVSGKISSVESQTHFHSEQEIWVKNIHSGQEKKFNFNTYNIDVRVGHKIVLSWNQVTQKLERIINISTNERYAGNGTYDTWSKKRLNKSTPLNFFFITLASIFCLIIPIFAPFFLLFILIRVGLAGQGFWSGAKIKGIRRYGLGLVFVGALFIPLFVLSNLIQSSFLVSLLFVAWIAAIATFIIKIINLEYNEIKTHSDALDGYLNNYISRLSFTTNEPARLA